LSTYSSVQLRQKWPVADVLRLVSGVELEAEPIYGAPRPPFHVEENELLQQE
jgi:hypothetical protein